MNFISEHTGGVAGGGRSPPEALRSHMTLGIGVREVDLNKRVRFEARVLTQ